MAKNPRFAEHRLYMAMTLTLGREPTDQEWDEVQDYLAHRAEFEDYLAHREEFLAWQARHTSNGSAESPR
jgi:hypothetical protein